MRSTTSWMVARPASGDSVMMEVDLSFANTEMGWAVNEKPSPPGGAALAFMRDLPRQPPDFDDWLRRFFAGAAPARIDAALEAIDWALPLLENVTS